jgi:HD-GYP domain-containing protein (c-di-GMP phosphodiesterase class II)
MARNLPFNVEPDDLNVILSKLDRLHHVRDLHSLLDTLLSETRQLVRADAGSIFLLEDGQLKFSYVQNDTLFQTDFLSNKYIYSNSTVRVDETSLAGWVAVHLQPLIIDDAYHLPEGAPYSFNASFDEISQYRTRSILTVPLVTGKKELLGVLQLINPSDESGALVPFTEYQRNFIGLFAFYAGVAIERALLLRDVVKKMLTMTQIRDPEETMPHVERVGAYSVELYQRWAEKRGVPREEIAGYKDVLRTAAMLHDIGKVGIADALLQKRGPLDDAEFEQMKDHVKYGAEFFKNPHSEWDTLALEITLNHHQHWDGTGYPEPIKKGNAIPLSARIVALADVYDALISRRAYKDPWEEEKVLHHLRSRRGSHFDPELVDIFFEIYDIIRAIRSKWES